MASDGAGEANLEGVGDAASCARVRLDDFACSLFSRRLRKSPAAFVLPPFLLLRDLEEEVLPFTLPNSTSSPAASSSKSLSIDSWCGTNAALKAVGSSMKNSGTNDRKNVSIFLRTGSDIWSS